ncbi:MAG: Uma2 family endonuclease [Fimbriimonadales bacterium]|nr:Uma2 family endonuclease [Fimbriimonadales bacterium]
MQPVVSTETRLPPSGKVSFEAFQEWLDEDTHAEWVDGEVVLKMPVSVQHQQTNNYLHLLVSAWLARYQKGEAFQPPLLVRFTLPDGQQIAREPDIVVVLNGNSGVFTEQYFDGALDLVVEVVSPTRRGVDRHTKFAEYEAAGVPEYWVIEPERRYAEFFQRDESGLYRAAFSGSEGVYRSRVLEGFWLELRWLWERPPLWDVFKELGLV